MEGAQNLISRTWIAGVLLAASSATAQMPQNPSPMVEHTRLHERLKQETPAGRRERLDLGTLFIPARLKGREAALLVFFHGGTWLPEVAAARNNLAVITIQVGAGSGVYARAFTESGRFSKLLAEAESKARIHFTRVILGGWSAGCGAIREILRSGDSSERIDAVVAIDGIHAGYTGGKPGPLESKLEVQDLEVWVSLAKSATAGRKRVLITHSEIFPGTFASTTETADYLVGQLGLRRRPVIKWGPRGTQQLSEVRAGKLLLAGYAGNSAPDHVDQLHSLPEYLKWMRR